MGEVVLTGTRFGFETVRGTAVAPTRKVYGVTDLTRAQPIALREENAGSFARTIGASATALSSAVAGGTHNDDATYEDFAWILEQALGPSAAITNPDGAGALVKRRVYVPSQATDALRSGTWQQSDITAHWQMVWGLVDELEITGAVGEPWRYRATLLGKDMTVLGALTGTANDRTRRSIEAKHTRLFMAAAGVEPAGGTTGHVVGTFIDFSLRIRNNFERKFFLQGDDTMAGTGRGHREVECDFTFEETADSLAERVNWVGKVERTIGIEARGDIITGAFPHRAMLIIPGLWDGWTLSSRATNRTFTMVLRGIYNTTLGYDVKAIVDNTIANIDTGV